MVKPYYEARTLQCMYRRFPKDVDRNLLIWHRDKRERVVKVITGRSWLLQFEDDIPFLLEEDESYIIPKMTYHRLIKGRNDLVLEIIEE